MRKPILAILALILASLSCGTYAPTITPAPTGTDTATPAPKPLSPTMTPTVSPTPNSIASTAVVVKTSVNVRLSPGGASIGTLREGDTVQVVSCADDWCAVTLYVWRGCLSGNEDLGCQSK